MTALAPRDRPPVAGEPRVFELPGFLDLRLTNGLRVLAARVEPFPLVSFDLLLRAGAQFDPPGRSGLASLHAGLLDEGTARLDALEIAAAIESLGGSLGSSADWNTAHLGAEVLAEHAPSALELIAELATTPSFPEGEVERLREERLTDILRQRDQPGVLAYRHFLRAVYRGTIYEELHTGSEEGVGGLERPHVTEHYERCVSPSSTALVAVGAIDPETLARRAEEIFGGWAERPAAPEPEIVPPRLSRTEVHLVDRPGAAQTQLHLGHAGPPRNHPDRHALTVLNTLFGGKFTSRINLNLRERHGFTYGAGSQFVSRRGPGPFLVQAAVATESTGRAAAELIGELERLVGERVPEAELDESRRYVVGVFPYTVQTAADLAGRLEDLVKFDLPSDYYDDYPALLAEVTSDDVLEAARRHLHPDRLAIVAVGPAEDLRPQLEPFGPVTVHTP